jgi:hypothetical protein
VLGGVLLSRVAHSSSSEAVRQGVQVPTHTQVHAGHLTPGRLQGPTQVAALTRASTCRSSSSSSGSSLAAGLAQGCRQQEVAQPLTHTRPLVARGVALWLAGLGRHLSISSHSSSKRRPSLLGPQARVHVLSTSWQTWLHPGLTGSKGWPAILWSPCWP